MSTPRSGYVCLPPAAPAGGRQDLKSMWRATRYEVWQARILLGRGPLVLLVEQFRGFPRVCLGQSVLAGGKRSDVWAGMARFDGVNYASIADRGYSYDPNKRSNVAFFPLLPVLARASWSSGSPPKSPC